MPPTRWLTSPTRSFDRFDFPQGRTGLMAGLFFVTHFMTRSCDTFICGAFSYRTHLRASHPSRDRSIRTEQIDLDIGRTQPLGEKRREVLHDLFADLRMTIGELSKAIDRNFNTGNVGIGDDIGGALSPSSAISPTTMPPVNAASRMPLGSRTLTCPLVIRNRDTPDSPARITLSPAEKYAHPRGRRERRCHPATTLPAKPARPAAPAHHVQHGRPNDRRSGLPPIRWPRPAPRSCAPASCRRSTG